MNSVRHKRAFPAGRLVLLAPPGAFVPRRFENVQSSASRYDDLLAGLQRLRGQLYLEDGAIGTQQITPDGRHQLADDHRSWHVLTVDRGGDVTGCARYLPHPNSIPFHRLTARHSAIASSAEWGALFRMAVGEDIDRARSRGVSFAEAGGWALAPRLRRSREAMRIALATYGLARALGECIGITTATRRHFSAEILRRIGGQSLRAGQIELPSYYDPQYGCEMEVLRFDSIHPHPRFQSWIGDLCGYWLTAPVICRGSAPAAFPHALQQPRPDRPARAFEDDLTLAVQ